MRNDILKSLLTNPGIVSGGLRSIAVPVSALQETSDRRSMLQRSALGIGALGLAHVLNADGRLNAMEAGPLNDRPSPFLPKAKRVIHFFLNGGPSHVDTFDPKPLLSKYAGQSLGDNLLTERKTGAAFPSPFKFRRYGQSGIEVSEIFSRMLMNCGDSVQPRPSMGAWVLYGLGTENQNLPGFVAMCPGGLPIKDTENWQSAFLPGAFQGTYVDSQHKELSRLIENIEHPQIATDAQRRQLSLLARLNAEHRAQRIDQRLDARIQSFELAFRMQHDAADAFDVTREPAHIQQMYGEGIHARQTLIARRLLERGVRYVQLWHGAGQPWDNHAGIEAAHRNLAGQIDQPIAALMTDLKQRGLFEDTLILWGGEFGRTPTVELSGDGKPQSGRDHNHWGFSVWLAGGGIKGGTVYGATDDIGFKAVDKPTSVHDLHATMLHCLGFDHKKLTFRYAGRDFRLTDVHGEVLHDILA